MNVVQHVVHPLGIGEVSGLILSPNHVTAKDAKRIHTAAMSDTQY